MVGGVSAGAIVSAGIATGTPMGKVVELAQVQGPEIFSKPFKYRMKSIFGLKGGKHDVHNLIKILEDAYGEGTMEDRLIMDFLCASYSMGEGKPRFFTGRKNPSHPLARTVAASSAAPTYFNPVTFYQKEIGDFVDGGLFCSNPAACTLAEYRSIHKTPMKDVMLVSVGTGNRQQTHFNVKNWFKYKWIKILIDTMMASDGGVVDYQMRAQFSADGCPENYYRIQEKLPNNIHPDMGKATKKNINNLMAFAEHTVRKNYRNLEEIAEKLKG